MDFTQDQYNALAAGTPMSQPVLPAQALQMVQPYSTQHINNPFNLAPMSNASLNIPPANYMQGNSQFNMTPMSNPLDSAVRSSEAAVQGNQQIQPADGVNLNDLFAQHMPGASYAPPQSNAPMGMGQPMATNVSQAPASAQDQYYQSAAANMANQSKYMMMLQQQQALQNGDYHTANAIGQQLNPTDFHPQSPSMLQQWTNVLTGASDKSLSNTQQGIQSVLPLLMMGLRAYKQQQFLNNNAGMVNSAVGSALSNAAGALGIRR